jgi:hypothetical protein
MEGFFLSALWPRMAWDSAAPGPLLLLYVLRAGAPVAQALAVDAGRCVPVTRVFPGAKACMNSYYYLPADK